MNLLVTTSGYIARLKELFGIKISPLAAPSERSAANMSLAFAKKVTFSKETAMHMLLDQGKTYREAELVISTLEEWGMALEQVSYLEFEVHGNSVWIKPD